MKNSFINFFAFNFSNSSKKLQYSSFLMFLANLLSSLYKFLSLLLSTFLSSINFLSFSLRLKTFFTFLTLGLFSFLRSSTNLMILATLSSFFIASKNFLLVSS
jgi:hypothetical protein